jgi:hypothetical protein
MRTKAMALLLTMTAAAGVAFAADVPHRRAGLWEIVTGASSTAAPRMSQRVCLDRETDELLDQAGIGVSQQMCSKMETRSNGNEVTVAAICNVGTSRMTSESVTTFTGDTAYQTKVHAVFDPPLAGRSSSDSVQEGKWAGPCPNDMRPGDMIMTSGGGHPHEMRTNLHDVLKPPS